MKLTPKRPRRLLAALAGAILVVLAVAGCNRGDSPGVPPAASVSAAPATTAPDASSPLPGDTSSASASDAIPPSPSASTTAAPATPDAVASELDQIQRLIDDINSSLSSSDGGE